MENGHRNGFVGYVCERVRQIIKSETDFLSRQEGQQRYERQRTLFISGDWWEGDAFFRRFRGNPEGIIVRRVDEFPIIRHPNLMRGVYRVHFGELQRTALDK